MQQVAAQLYPLQQIGLIPGVGPICAGPLGPGPCEAIRADLMQQQPGAAPSPGQPLDPTHPQLVSNNGTSSQAMCSGPLGPVPCTLLGQMSLDRFSGQIPSASSFAIPMIGNDPQKLAIPCARRVGLDIDQFAGCAGQQIILPHDQQAVLDCAVSSQDTASFANCAAPNLGIRIPDDQRVLAQCAMRSRGDRNAFVTCAGGSFLNRNFYCGRAGRSQLRGGRKRQRFEFRGLCGAPSPRPPVGRPTNAREVPDPIKGGSQRLPLMRGGSFLSRTICPRTNRLY